MLNSSLKGNNVSAEVVAMWTLGLFACKELERRDPSTGKELYPPLTWGSEHRY